MREILFKAKRKDNGEWTKGYYYETYWKNYILFGMMNGVPNMTEVFPDTLCQYTGMTDDNGNRIFENDIILLDELGLDCHTESGKVYYDNQNFRYAVEFYEGEIDTYPLSEYNEGNGVKVIGNVFDNPELLEVEK